MRYRKFRQQRRSIVNKAPRVFICGLLLLAVLAFTTDTGSMASIEALAMGCGIKGNISLNTGEKIYHMPGQTDYDDTRIRLDRGERWFCSEADAVAAGWRKAGN